MNYEKMKLCRSYSWYIKDKNVAREKLITQPTLVLQTALKIQWRALKTTLEKIPEISGPQNVLEITAGS